MNDRIPLLDLRAEYEPLKERILAVIAEVLDGMQLYQGRYVKELEERFAAYCGTRHAIGVGSGTEALVLALWASGVGPGDEVIVPSLTFIATPAAVACLGARPVFVDVEPETCTMDVRRAEAAVTSQTKAIVPVHLYGQTADMEPIVALARRRGLRVIEDACQAVGAEYGGRRAGSLADAAAFSFVFTKNLKAYGDAGMVTTDDEALADRVAALRDHGRADKYTHPILGLNCRLDEIQAAIVCVKLDHIEAWTESRRRNADFCSRALTGSSLGLPHERPGGRHVYHQYVVRSSRRDALAHHLSERGIATGVHYPVPCHLQEWCLPYGAGPGSLPVSEALSREVLSLPVYPELTSEQRERVVSSVIEFCALESLPASAGGGSALGGGQAGTEAAAVASGGGA
jgi:dTDP-4-amino-4,6-dideoxygalactose transaminase